MDDEVRRADEPKDGLGDRESAEYRDELFDEHVTGALEGIGAPAQEPHGAETAVPQTTEWFSVEDYLALEDEVPALPLALGVLAALAAAGAAARRAR
jgi:hypothetical protein